MNGGTFCKWCGLPIKWAATAGGKRMPLDVDPNPAGNIVIRDGRAVVLSTAEYSRNVAGPRLTSHFATCPKRPARKRR
jgi:hypothetical protein